jgi:hypothetical protein
MSANKDIQPIEKPSSPAELQQEETTSLRTRRELAWAITGLLIIVSVIAACQKGALPVLDKVLPLAAIIFGFFFGHRTSR